jgi:hypothetical protein
MEISTGVNCYEKLPAETRQPGVFLCWSFAAKGLSNYGKICTGLTVSLSEHKTEGMLPTKVGV